MQEVNGDNNRTVKMEALSEDRSLFIAVPRGEMAFSVQVPHEFIDQVEMYSKLIGISQAEFVRFAVYELVHHYRHGALKKIADGE